MDKWFNDNLETSNLRRHTIKRISDNNHSGFKGISRKLSITNWIIIVNILVYIAIVILISSGYDYDKVFSMFAIQANSFFSGDYWTLFTSMFSHVWMPHLIFNMISLFFIGNFLEKIIGRKKFFWFYLLSGLFAGIFYVTLSFFFGTSELGARIFISPDAYSLGASGAIFGIAGLLAILTPKMKVYLIAGPILAIIIQSVLLVLFSDLSVWPLIDLLITFYIFFSIFSMFSFNPQIRKLGVPIEMSFWVLPIVAIIPLIVIGFFIDLPIGNTAHLGGIIAGVFYGAYLKKKYKRKTEMISRYFRR